MLKDDVKKDSRIKKKKNNKQKLKLDKKKKKERENALSAHFFNNTIDITLPSPNNARDT